MKYYVARQMFDDGFNSLVKSWMVLWWEMFGDEMAGYEGEV